MIINLSENNSILSNWIAQLRDVNVQTDRMRFRRNLERIGEIAAYELSKKLEYTERDVETPLGEAKCAELTHKPVIATILRAGLPLHQGLLNYFDDADNAFVAAYRKHHRDGSFEIEQQYSTCPSIDGRPLIIADPMIATGQSLVISLKSIINNEKPSQIHIVCAIACSVGLEYVKRKYPEAYIWAGAVDDELTAKAYIVPGLGDAGDLAFGEKKQS